MISTFILDSSVFLLFVLQWEEASVFMHGYIYHWEGAQISSKVSNRANEPWSPVDLFCG